MQFTPNEEYLARHCYGYGRWDARYWFVGPEQGMGSETIDQRTEAFRDTDRDQDGLCDCRAFHEKIHETKWHRSKCELQTTWNYQMALLYGYWGKPPKVEIRRSLQRNGWGCDGRVCIAELRGLPARSKAESKDQREFLDARADRLKHEIDKHAPEFVVFYGKEDEEYWNRIANVNKGLILDGIAGRGDTLFAYLPHPVAFKPFKRSHDDWKRIGEQLCQKHKNLKSRLI
jgi:hypothetical protein